jgi:hypothetical protein
MTSSNQSSKSSKQKSKEADYEWEVLKVNTRYLIHKAGQHPIKDAKTNHIVAPSATMARKESYVLVRLFQKELKSTSGKIKKHYKTWQLHTLVAIQWLDYDPNDFEFEINHKDRNPRNNNVGNLEIVNTAQNGRCAGRKQEFVPIAHMPRTALQVLAFVSPRTNIRYQCETLFLDRKGTENINEWDVWVLTSNYEGRMMTRNHSTSKPEKVYNTVPFIVPISKKLVIFNFRNPHLYKLGPALGDLTQADIDQLMKRIEEDDHIQFVRTHLKEKKKLLEYQLALCERKEEEVEEIRKRRSEERKEQIRKLEAKKRKDKMNEISTRREHNQIDQSEIVKVIDDSKAKIHEHLIPSLEHHEKELVAIRSLLDQFKSKDSESQEENDLLEREHQLVDSKHHIVRELEETQATQKEAEEELAKYQQEEEKLMKSFHELCEEDEEEDFEIEDPVEDEEYYEIPDIEDCVPSEEESESDSDNKEEEDEEATSPPDLIDDPEDSP